jgi:hypothetical protein
MIQQTNINDGSPYIGGAFNGCTNLTTVKNFKEFMIGPNMFRFCEKLQNIDLSRVTIISNNAFEGCL